MAQNIASLGIDISSFSPDKLATLDRFIAVFEKIDKFDGKSIAPVVGAGLAEFNTAVSSSSKLLVEINENLTKLNTNLTTTGTSTTKATSKTKELTDETAKLKVQIQEANKALLDSAKAQNASVQAREADKKSKADAAKAEAQFEAARKEATKENIRLDKEKSASSAKLAADQKKAAADLAKTAREKGIADRKSIADGKEKEKALRDESRATEKLTNDYLQLKLAQQEQATRYANTFIAQGGGRGGTDTPQAKAALAEYQATSDVINRIETNLEKASKGASNFGRGISAAFGQIRTLAYILPGIGIAGIFNLAFEAIGNAVSSLGIFNDKVLENYKRTKDVNSALIEQLNLYKNITDQKNKLFQQDEKSASGAKRVSELIESQGFDKGELLKNKAIDAQIAYDEANAKSLKIGGENAKKSIDQYIKDQKEISDRIIELNRIINAKNEMGGIAGTTSNIGLQGSTPSTSSALGGTYADFTPRKTVDGKVREGQEQLKANAETERQILETKKAYNEESIKLLQDTLDAQTEANNAKAELDKFRDDEARRRRVEIARQDIELSITKNNAIIDDDRRAEKEKTDALAKNYQLQLKLNKIELGDVVDNISNTPATKAIARNKKADEDRKAKIDFDKKLYDLETSFEQRRLRAQEAIDKNEVEAEAIKQERVFKNENKGLDERLKAYTDYIKRKQELQDIEYELAITDPSLRSGDETAKKEIERLNSDRATQKVNIQADAEKQVYDIVYQSTQKQLKLIEQENKISDESRKTAYTKELNDINTQFKNKEINYVKYTKERKRIDHDYAEQSLDLQIEDDKKAIERLQTFLEKEVKMWASKKNDLSQAKDNLNFSKDAGEGVLEAQRQVDELAGVSEGYYKGIQNSEEALALAKKKLEDDEFKRASLKYQQDLKLRQQWYNAAKAIEQNLYRVVKESADQNYEYRVQKNRDAQAAIDEQYQNEIDAIEKSSLSAKDKAALDIQLNAQRQQHAKEAAKEEKRIKHDQALFDQQIAIAHILLSTATAVAEAWPIVPLAIAAGAAGAAELAIASNVKIPGYEHGTGSIPHPGGLARTGEKGKPEVVFEPYKSPYLVLTENVSYLPKGTEVVPMEESPDFSKKQDTGWEQFRWLAKQMKKNNQEIKNVFSPIIKVDIGTELYRRKILGN